ncbi:MAG TPA: helix-turn-helix domain-containing protein [Planctomycetota bacterium]|nr:helix-turn-helix domain-containing protein [Planctomycetota bacterium]
MVETAKSIPVAAMVEDVVGCKWSLRLLGILARGPARPSAMLRASPGLSAKVLNERIRKFQRFGLVHRRVAGERPPIEVEYSLTEFGGRFAELLAAVERLQDELDRGVVQR